MKKAIALILFALCPLTGLVLVQNDLLQRQASYREVRLELQAALDSTMTRQKNISNDLRADPALQQNLSLEMFGGAGRILAGYAQAGKIDRLALVDQTCRIVTQSEQGLPLHNECDKSELEKIDTPLTQWQATPQGIRVSLVTPLPSIQGVRYFLKASTLLGEAWLQNFPHLAELSKDLGLSFQPKSKAGSRLLWKSSATLPIVLEVYANDWWFLIFPQVLSDKNLDLTKSFLLCLFMLFSGLILLANAVRARQHNIQKTLQQLTAWTIELGAQPFESSPQDGLDIETLKGSMSRIVKKNLESQTRLEHQTKLLQQQIVKLESRIIEQQTEQAWFHQAQSLHQQMQSCATAYIEKLQESISLGEDLSYVASREIFKPAQRLFDMSSRWDLELSKQNPKKFLRTLTERVDESGVSELEGNLDRLIQDSHNVGNCAINLSMLSQRLIQELKATLTLAQHWQAMMKNGVRDQHTILGLLQESQALIKLQGEFQDLHYDNAVDPLMEGHKIPASTMTSVLYHSHLALMETAREKGARQLHITTQIKKRSDRHILVISLRSDGQDQLEPGSDLPPKASQHLSLAIQLLQGYDIKITSLPPLPGVYALALMWQPESSTDILPLKFEPTARDLQL